MFEDGRVIRKIPELAEGVQRPGKTNFVIIALFLAILETELQAVLATGHAEGVAKTVGILGEYTRRIFSLGRSKPDSLRTLKDVLYLSVRNPPIDDSLGTLYFVKREPAEIQSHFVQLGRRDDPVP